MQRPSKTQIKRSLAEGAFDPRAPGVGLAMTIEEGDPKYFEIRAIECIREARQIREQSDLPPAQQYEYYQDRMNKALSLIALAKVTVQ